MEVRHDIVEQAVGLTGIEERQNMGMGKPGDKANLPEEPLGSDRDGELRVNDLEGDVAVMPEVVGEIDRGGATPPQKGEAPIRLPFDSVPIGERRRETFVSRYHSMWDQGYRSIWGSEKGSQ